jgi:hypothetical protein
MRFHGKMADIDYPAAKRELSPKFKFLVSRTFLA